MPFRLKSRNYHVVAYNISILAEGLHFSALVYYLDARVVAKAPPGCQFIHDMGVS